MSLRQRQELGQRVRQARERLGLDRLHFAQKARISRNTLQTLEEASKETTDRVLDKIAVVLGTTTEALIGTPPLDPNDPKFKDLTDDDFEVAQAYHHAALHVKQRLIGVLQTQAARRDRLHATISDWVQRLLALREDQRAMLVQLITELETHPPAPVETTAPAPPPESLADRLRQDIWHLLDRLGAESLQVILDLIIGFIRTEQRSARDQKPEQRKRLQIAAAAKAKRRRA